MIEEIIQQQGTGLIQFSPTSAYFLDKDMNDELDIERRGRKDIVYNLSPELDIDMLSEELLHKTDISEIYFETILEVAEKNRERIENSIGNYVDFIKNKFASVEDTFIEYPKGTFNAVYNRLNISDFINEETKFVRTLEAESDSMMKFKMVHSHCVDIISTLRNTWYGLSDTDQERLIVKKEIRKMILNIRNFLYCTDIKNINNIYLRLLSIDTITVSNITVMKNNMQRAEKTMEVIEDSLGNLMSLHDMKILIDDGIFLAGFRQKVNNIYKHYAKDVSDENLERTILIEKKINLMKSANLPVMYSTGNGVRPNKEFGDIEHWNGLQAFDLDIKMCGTEYKCPFRNKMMVKDWIYKIEDIDRFKNIIHERLSKYSWYICTKTSYSGKGLHIITKVKPFQHLYKNPIDNRNINNYWFRTNYIQKFSIIRWILLNECGIPMEHIDKVIDKSMGKISQGIVMIPDPKALWNDNFLDLPLIYGFHIPPKDGLKPEDWILDEPVLQQLQKSVVKAQGHDTMSSIRNKTKHQVNYKPVYETIAYDFASVEMPMLENVIPIDESRYQSGGRDKMRMRCIGTLIYIYGDGDEVNLLARHLLKVPQGVLSDSEFIQKWRYGKRNKFVYDDMINILRACGCTFDISSTVLEDVKDSKLHKAVEALRDTDITVNEVMPDYSFNLPKNRPYLGEITTDLLGSLEQNKVNVIESAAGSGKTTLFNNLASEYRICLVAPFTTILSNKVEYDPIASELFDVFYGTKKLKFEGNRSVAMTFDKFERMTKEEYKMFDLIAVDESHLLFTSAYRSMVTTGVAKNVKGFIEHDMAKKESMKLDIGHTSVSGSILENTSLFKTMSNTGVKIVLMTGTITGELLYYRNSNVLNYIKVNSKHKYGKNLEIILTDSQSNSQIVIAQNIAKDIQAGKTVIAPTNKGNEYVAAIIDQVNYITKGMVKPDEWIYYKKENSEHPICLSITKESKLPKQLKIIFCSLYLSVGVDIISERDYSTIVDGDSNTAQDIEQYNNRIRRSKINCKIVYSALATSMSGLTEIKKSIYSTPSEIVLKKVSEHTSEISDDRRIASSNLNINKKDDYNSLKLPENLSLKELYHNTSSRGVEFNEDKFLIDGFTRDYIQVAKGAAYTKYVLTNYYGYNVKYRVAVMDDDKQLNILQEIGKDAKSRVIAEKMDAFLKTIDFIVQNYDKIPSKYEVGLMSVRKLDFSLSLIKGKGSKYKDYQDKNWVLEYPMNFEDMFKEAYYKMRFLTEIYTPENASKFLKSFVSKSNRLNKAELKRTIALIHMIRNARKKDLPLATTEMYDLVSDFLNGVDGETIIQAGEFEYLVDEMSMRDIESQMQDYADVYYKIMSGEGVKIESIKRRTEMADKGVETLKTVFKVRRQKDGYYKLKARILPYFDTDVQEELDNFDRIMDLLRGTIVPSVDVEQEEPEKVLSKRTIHNSYGSKTSRETDLVNFKKSNIDNSSEHASLAF